MIIIRGGVHYTTYIIYHYQYLIQVSVQIPLGAKSIFSLSTGKQTRFQPVLEHLTYRILYVITTIWSTYWPTSQGCAGRANACAGYSTEKNTSVTKLWTTTQFQQRSQMPTVHDASRKYAETW